MNQIIQNKVIITDGGWLMARRAKGPACCDLGSRRDECCSIESLVPVDERGQMVLPKELRERAGIRAGDKLAIISCQKDGVLCCLILVKADSLAERVKEFLGPVIQTMSKDPENG